MQTIRTVCKIQTDETRQTVVAPRFEGWISKLYADAIGQQVKKGDALFDFYSPEVVRVESEYIVSADNAENTENNGSLERLRMLNIPIEEITRLRRVKKSLDHICCSVYSRSCGQQAQGAT
jgi:Cu(I)/Ag(I) efflux system membrane fusion protein